MSKSKKKIVDLLPTWFLRLPAWVKLLIIIALMFILNVWWNVDGANKYTL